MHNNTPHSQHRNLVERKISTLKRLIKEGVFGMPGPQLEAVDRSVLETTISAAVSMMNNTPYLESGPNSLLLAPADFLTPWRGAQPEVQYLPEHSLRSLADARKIMTTKQERPKELWDILGKIDRYDVRDNAAEKRLIDIKIAAEAAAKKGLDLNRLNAAETPTGGEALTIEDLDCLNSGKLLPTYDAFVLYGKEDEHIISEIVATLEAQGLKILIKDRDLLGGTFEHAAVMELISTRCTKLVPLFSNSFFSSEYNKFLANFAQHISLEKASRKIVPVVSEERCEIPPNLALYYKFKYQPNNPLFNFWEKLVKTINPDIKYNPQRTPKIIALSANQSKQPSTVPVKPASTPKNNSTLETK